MNARHRFLLLSICTLAAVLLVAGHQALAGSPSAKRPALVFLIAGQSNAGGCAVFAPETNFANWPNRAEDFKKIDSLRKEIAEYEREELAAAQVKWEKSFDAAKLTWHPLTASKAESKLGAKLQLQKDASILASGPNKTGDLYTIEAPLER